MVDSLLIGIVTTGLICSEVLDWLPSFWRCERGSLADAIRIKQWDLITLCHLRDRQCRTKKSLGFFMLE